MWKKDVPFEFRGQVRPEPSYKYLSILEAASRRGRPHTLSASQQRQKAKAEQAKSGIRVRIDRLVANYEDFMPQLRAWDIKQAQGDAARRQLGVGKRAKRLEMTVLDTRSQTLGYIDETMTQEDLERRLRDDIPSLFKETGRILFTSPELFGKQKTMPWVALPISLNARQLHDERQAVREIVAPSTRLSTAHIRDDQMHVSLGDITVHDSQKVNETFQTLCDGIIPLLPQYVVLGPARVTVDQIPQ